MFKYIFIIFTINIYMESKNNEEISLYNPFHDDVTQLNKDFDMLVKWIISNGGYINEKLSLKLIDHSNRAIIANSKIDKDEFLFKIPINLYINELTDCPYKHTNSTIQKILTLYYNKFILDTKSFFYPYIKLLPQNISNFSYHPIISVDNNFEEDFPEFVVANNKNKKEIKTNFEIIKLIIPDITEEQELWCELIFRTRQWKIQGLIPFADLFQHSNNSDITLISDNKISITKTFSEINKNEIVYDNYGVYDDSSLYINFGFVETDCKQKVTHIQLNFDAVDTTLGRLVKSEYDNAKFDYRLHFLTSSGISSKLIEALRILNLSDIDIKIINFKEKYYEKEISIENERRCIESLLKIIKFQINKFDDKYITKINKMLSEYKTDFHTYKMACLIKSRIDTFKSCCLVLTKKWLEKLNSPFNMVININY